MKLSPSLIDHAAEALAAVMRFEYPADGVLSRYFRAHHSLGQQDRGFIAETVFAVLRRKRLLDYLLGDTGARAVVLACLAVLRGHNLRELEAVCSAPELEKLGAIKQRAHEALPFEVECDLPDWVVEKLRASHDDAALLELARGLQRPAPLDLRVNLAKTTREAALESFAASGVPGAAMSYSPAGIRLKEKPALS
ncbi:MAG: SAM-dependent methyltransferase, partial [Proteobacteria bacterium]|nr:SAM-dependent methyltransferase [Pseudomonadota bacterium]